MSISAMTMAQHLLLDSCIIKWLRNACSVYRIVLIFLLINVASAEDIPLKILESSFEGSLGKNATLSCLIEPSNVNVSWMFGDKIVDTKQPNFHIRTNPVPGKPDADGNKRMAIRVSLIIHKTNASHHGPWACVAKKIGNDEESVDAVGALFLAIPTMLVEITSSPVRLKPSTSTVLTCIYEGFNLSVVKWRKQENNKLVPIKFLPGMTNTSVHINETHVKGTLKLVDVTRKENGTYVCGVREHANNVVVNEIDVLVLEPPQIVVDYIKGVGERKIYMNWTINDGYSPIERYMLQLRRNGSEQWAYHSSPVDPTATSFLITDLEPNQDYQIKITAKNDVDWGKPYMDNKWIKTLVKDPEFIPEVSIKGFTVSSMTVGWVQPPPELREYVHYYELTAQQANNSQEEGIKKAIHSGEPLFLFDMLTPASRYTFKVRACSELTKECGSWSEPVNATTLDGLSGPVTGPVMMCHHDNVSDVSFVDIVWLEPSKPNGIIKNYNVVMTGTAKYVNAAGIVGTDSWGPMTGSTPDYTKQVRFNNVPHNTNFTARISAVTRSRNLGQPTVLNCNTPAAAPSRDSLQGFYWDKVQEVDGRWMFKLHLPRVTERNGAICCYRVILVRMGQDQKLSDMPSPEDLALSSYNAVHKLDKGGAYVAEVYSSDNLQSEVILGDGLSPGNNDKRSLRQCEMCVTLANKMKPLRIIPRPVTSLPITSTPAPVVTTPTKVGPTTVSPHPTTVLPVNADRSNTEDSFEAEIKKKITGFTEDEEELESEEKQELRKKSKRQFPTSATSRSDDKKKLVLHDLQQYQNSPADTENLIRQTDVGYVSDKKYFLDDDFYINKRIYHQNKGKQQSDDFDVDKFAKKLQKQDDTWTDDYARSDVRDIESFDHDDSDFESFTNNDEEDIEDDVVPIKSASSRIRDYNEYSDRHNHNVYDARLDGVYFEERSLVKKRNVKHEYQHAGSKYSAIAHKRTARQAVEKEFEDVRDQPIPVRPEYSERVKKMHETHNTPEYERVKKLHETAIGERVLSDKVVAHKDQDKSSFADPGLPETVATFEKSIYDGFLNIDSNYTGFVELLVHTEGSSLKPIYSNYFSVLNPGPDSIPDEPMSWSLIIIIVLAVGLGLIVLMSAIALCALRLENRRSAPHHGVEMHNIHNTLRNICQGLRGGRHQLVSQTPPDLPPIAKQDLLQAYLEREIDSGYKFQNEFERLPDFFMDRTMEVSEAKENQGKNRYPDIKAYDQTRVKLSFVDGALGSDYINANYVMGYKERKKFICAQGPTDVTVGDFWRMIWEQNLDLLVMLTNLEECSKVKCAKYWPDQNNPQKVYAGTIHVQHVSEKRYSDYIVRELKITKRSSSESNSHIIESNGVKKNGEVTNGNGAVSTGTGATTNSTGSSTPEERIVKQYHYLMWKDFVAPEHPHAILKFIKRVNEAAIGGKTILVHCSAGVGRTGTMVALDCLLDQLDAEGQVAVFNTVCDLRRQRNYLVQSLKQYVFIYRALLEYALYSDTEIPVVRLKSTVDRLRQIDTCEMEEEFEKLKQPYLDLTKPCVHGRAPENLAKNRSEAVVPYDHNRVILAPIATRENSTYINASFIEGYDNSESYIIAQDPLPTTLADFWRMVSEQEITTIVMLSELGEGKCPRYWDDEEIQYDHMSVRYLQSESCPYYTRREFQVTNTKNQERINVTQLQYHGWPTVSGQVPEVTRGLIELVGQSGASPPATPPILVHCSLGTERSSMFVALCILITQLRTEQRVDVSTITRKLRSQRMGCLDTFLQYEFLYRAIVNYAELHNLLNSSS